MLRGATTPYSYFCASCTHTCALQHHVPYPRARKHFARTMMQLQSMPWHEHQHGDYRPHGQQGMGSCLYERVHMPHALDAGAAGAPYSHSTEHQVAGADPARDMGGIRVWNCRWEWWCLSLRFCFCAQLIQNSIHFIVTPAHAREPGKRRPGRPASGRHAGCAGRGNVRLCLSLLRRAAYGWDVGVRFRWNV